MSLPEFSVRRPVTIAMFCIGLAMVGGIALTRLPVELYPNFSFGDISIIIDIRGGMPPEEVEHRVTKPVEETVSDAGHLKDVISISEEGRSRVVLTFEPGTDMDFAALEVREKFSKVRSKLPKEIEKPVIAKFEQEDTPVLIVAVTALDYTPEMLRRIVDETIKDQIMRVPGVANVDVGGGRERKILVEVDLEKLEAFRLPIDRVTRLLSVSNLNLLTGEVNRSRTKYMIRAMGEFRSLDEIKELGISVTPTRSIIRLKDIAEVKDSFLEATSIARVDALPVVSLYVQKETTANTVEVVRRALGAFDRMQEDPRLPRNLRFIVTHDQSVHIKRAIEMVGSALVSGGVLAILVLGAFLSTHRVPRMLFIPLAGVVTLVAVLAYRFAVIPVKVVDVMMLALLAALLGVAAYWRHLRLTLICALAIPIATVVTFGFMFFLNFFSKPMGFMSLTLNIMTLGGLAMGVGMLVDNSIVVLDQIVKRRSAGEPPREASGRAAREMMLAILASTVTTAVVFLPIVFINKEIRILYVGFAMTICFSLVASLVVSLSVVPLMASRFRFTVERGVRGASRLRTGFRRLLSLGIRWRWVVALVAFFVGWSGMLIFQSIPKEFIGTPEAEDFTIFVELPSGAKLEVSDEAVAKIEKVLTDLPEKKTVSSRIEKWSSKVYVKLVPLAERSRSTKDIIDSLRPQVEEVEKGFKEAFIYFEEPQETESNEIILEIYGWDYETLNQIAVEMMKKMQTVPGLTDMKIRWRRGRPEWLVKVDKVKAARFGLTVDDIAQALHAQMRGLRATLYHAEAKEVEVITRLEEADRATLDKLRRITFTLPSREVVSLEQVARLEPAIGASKIWRKNKQRMIQVSANRGRYAFGEAADKIFTAVQDLPLPEEYYWRFGPNYWKLRQNQQEMAFALGLSLVLIFLVLASLFESFWQPFLILIEVPLGCFGALLLLKLTGQAVNVGALMGFILLGGIVVNNAIILVDEINRLRSAGRRVRTAILGAATSRLRPIAMSSFTSILGLLPLAMSRAEESSLWAPMALVTIGGLALSTFLTPVVIPCLYLCFEDAGKAVSYPIRLLRRFKASPAH